MRWRFFGACRYSGHKGEVLLGNSSVATIAAMVVLSPRGRIERAPAIEALWCDENWTLKRRRFNTAVWRLRSLIRKAGGDPAIELVTESAGLSRRRHDPADSDAGALASAAALVARREGRDLTPEDEARLTAAIRYYTGDFLPRAADHWCLVTRESLRTSLVIVLDALARHHRRHGNWPRVNALAHRILGVDSAIEEAHRMLIEGHCAMNDFASARRQYALCARLLRDTLDVEPAEETRRALEAGGAARAPETAEARRTVTPQSAAISRALHHLDAATACLTNTVTVPRR